MTPIKTVFYEESEKPDQKDRDNEQKIMGMSG